MTVLIITDFDVVEHYNLTRNSTFSYAMFGVYVSVCSK